MCTEIICQDYWRSDSGGDRDTPSIAIRYMDLNGRPFAAIIVDRRTGEHLHFPYDEAMDILAGGRV